MESPELLALVAIGLFAGLVGGMLGVGGSIVMIPAMTELLGPNQHLYQAAAMIVNFFVVVPAVMQHRRARAIDASIVMRLIPVTLLAVLVGVGISELSFFADQGEAYLRGLFGLFLMAVAASDLVRLFRSKRRGRDDTGVTEQSIPCISWPMAACVAIPTGLIAGLLGVGGGIMAVPLQRRFLRVPIRVAIANSAALIIPTSLLGAMAKNYAYVTGGGGSTAPMILAGVLIPTAILGSLCGSRLTHRAPLQMIRAAFFLLLLTAAIRLTYAAAQSIQVSKPNVPSATSLALTSSRSSRCFGPRSPKR